MAYCDQRIMLDLVSLSFITDHACYIQLNNLVFFDLLQIMYFGNTQIVMKWLDF